MDERREAGARTRVDAGSGPPAGRGGESGPRTVRLPRRGLSWLVAVAVVLVLAAHLTVLLVDAAVRPLPNVMVRFFDLNEELNGPTWFASTLFLTSAALLGLIAAARRGRRYARHWGALALLFLYFSLDESASLHEVANRLQGVLGTGGALSYAWVIPGAALVAVLGVTFWRFLRDLPAATRRGFLLAGAVFVGGAIGVEMIGAYVIERVGDRSAAPYVAVVTLEETLELAGLAIFVSALLAHLDRHVGPVRLEIASRARTQESGRAGTPASGRAGTQASGRAGTQGSEPMIAEDR